MSFHPSAPVVHEARAGSRIAAVADFRPERIVSNTELGNPLGVSAEWIERRVGIRERRFAGPGDSVPGMGAHAAAKALSTAGLGPADVDLVILATCSMPSPMPNGAASVAALLGIPTVAAFDVNAACAGFCYALGIADGLVRSGTSRCALVVGAERMTDWVDPTDVDTATIFADGAGAAVVVPAERTGIHPVVWGGDGEKASLVAIPDRHSSVTMSGQAVYRWVTTELTEVARAACAHAGVAPGDLKGFVTHQANLRMIEHLARTLGATGAAIARDIVETGNTSAASVPLALTRLIDLGRLRSGDPVLLMGFGAGLSYAAQVVTCP
ncbi:beta-ketoacyl-ACP synthase III [Streptomyces sp. FXJ1.172]|uniref:beta-ketoacyl-ACP synthase III n=1 Tax=Streptomyces sp. FXJ1.172 TaxID=710705 RepID=UPI0007CF9DBF|nr:beta-ketoacyl-ACP synthase III [Streptomyces sp. FXJ1.172]WEO99069.1 ketoacyl-ACP synthase III [Streptomyces sp. FXJ1.172]